MIKRELSKTAGAVLLAATFFTVGAGTATATPRIVEPSASPYIVQPAAAGKLAPFTITVDGFRPGQQVYVEQCDGVAITDPHWTPSVDCDSGTSPAPVFTPASGTVVFDKANLNHRFTPVKGLSPQGDFVCFGSSTLAGVPAYPTCKVRVSTNNGQSTTDQVFVELVPVGYRPSTSPTSSASSSSTTAALVGVGVVVIAAIAAVIVLRLRRRARSHA